MCTSDLVSSKWIDSLFNSKISRLSPLDFRLTAAAQFRLHKTLCSLTADGIELFRQTSLDYSFISTKVVSRHSLGAEMDAVVTKFNALIQTTALSSQGFQFLTIFIMLSRAISAVHTNAFRLSIPESDQYEIINNFYPRYDNASYDNVSYFSNLF